MVENDCSQGQNKKLVWLPSPYLPKEILPIQKNLFEFKSDRFFFFFFFFFNHFISKEALNSLEYMLSINYGRHAAFYITIIEDKMYIKFM